MIKKNWKQIFNPVWLLATVLIFIFILPELFTLYMQFDLHPEKTIFNRKNVSGLHFFFWESQIGRFFNTAPMKGSGDPFFFFHTILWAFLPWGILYYIASFLKIKRNFKKVQQEEFYTIFGSLAAILIFSLSKFQLPHYTNIVFPFMAIMVADFIYKLQNHYKNLIKTYAIILWLQNTIGVLIVIYLFIILKPEPNFNFYVFIVLSFVVILSIYKSKLHKTIKLGLTSSIIFLTIFSFLFTHFYTVILKYQGDVTAAKFTNKYYKGNAALIDNNAPYFGFEFYVDGKLEFIKINNVKKQKRKLFYIGKQEYKLLKKNDINFTIIKEIEHFHISKLNAKFLNKPTRNNQLENRFLVEIE